jgi:hypothetical protein
VLEDILLDREGLPPSWRAAFGSTVPYASGCERQWSTRSSDPRPAESLSALTRTLSEAFASEDGALLLGRLQALSLAARPLEPTAASRTRRRHRVWEPRRAKGRGRELVRSPARASEWRFWADVERIGPKRKRRVVLLGESVARGYLYDPALTPAGVLASMMPRREVVDLARTDLTMKELGGLLDGAACPRAGRHRPFRREQLAQPSGSSSRTWPAWPRPSGNEALRAAVGCSWTEWCCHVPARCWTPWPQPRATCARGSSWWCPSSTCATGGASPRCWRPSCRERTTSSWLAAHARGERRWPRPTSRRRRPPPAP